MTFCMLDSRTSPFKVMDPLRLSFAIRLANASISVDLPDPLAPRTAIISPSRASPEIPFNSILVFTEESFPDLLQQARGLNFFWIFTL
uniref:Uncharacterized protein n=1 Tax=Arabidopsis thaliana TaxID=3702 RepID=Q0WMN3_ARATH|nr:hypothetical protein [Arabidopsis thaliana]